MTASDSDRTAEGRAARIERAVRFESIGLGSETIAHDLNNLLTAILGNTELMQDMLDDVPESRRSDWEECVDAIATAGARASDLTGQLLGFCRRRPEPARATDLGAYLTENLEMFRCVMGVRHRIALTTPPGPLTVRFDEARMDLLLSCLFANIRDAQPEGGVVEVNLARRADDDGSGHHAEVRIADSGRGMSEDLRDRVLAATPLPECPDPPLGLGTPIIHRMLQQLEGTLAIESEPGRGTTVCVRFPVREPDHHPPA